MKSLLPLLPYLKARKWKLISGTIFVVISIFLQSLYPMVIGNAVDEITNKTAHYSYFQYALLSLSLIITGGAFLFLTRKTIIVASREIENDLRHDFFEHLMTLPKEFFDRNSTGDIMAHATNDINNIRNFLGPGIMYSIQTLLRTVVTLIIMFGISIKISLLALIPLPLISLLVYKVMKTVYGRSQKVQESFSDLTTKVQENFAGIRVVKSYVRELSEIDRFVKVSADYQKKSLLLARIQSYSFPMMFLLTSLSVIVVVYFGGLEVIKGNLSLGNVTEFIVYLGQLTWPMIAFGWVINLVQRASPSMDRIMKIMNTPPAVEDNEHSDRNITTIKGNVEFKNVNFKYPSTDVYVLKNINLKIPEGSSLGIIGQTGCGKSTLVNLIPRVYEVTEGQILIDGRDIKSVPINVLRNSVGVVPQESFLFSDTIGNNVSYSSDDCDEDNVRKSSEIAGLYKDVHLFPENFKTIIGERGVTLSGGQKQRTSIARAVYKKPDILILDDSLSAVDTSTEEEILQGLKDVLKDRTTIVISHRISTLKNLDKIIVIDNHTIAEEGTHEELLVKKGHYYNIHVKQLLEEEIEEM
ncbi:MAG: ABC transporter ATP-binding protein/permease [Bacteroidetes bacterium]|nr:ABC transporter ATP-binding protein/permease [Bacteroidota bacterium]